jgi:hypothetical protein
MNRAVALTLTILSFLLFFLLTYYGASVTGGGAFIFATIVSLILLNIFYPINQTAEDEADFTLVIYALWQILGILLIIIYVLYVTLSSKRTSYEMVVEKLD